MLRRRCRRQAEEDPWASCGWVCACMCVVEVGIQKFTKKAKKLNLVKRCLVDRSPFSWLGVLMSLKRYTDYLIYDMAAFVFQWMNFCFCFSNAAHTFANVKMNMKVSLRNIKEVMSVTAINVPLWWKSDFFLNFANKSVWFNVLWCMLWLNKQATLWRMISVLFLWPATVSETGHPTAGWRSDIFKPITAACACQDQHCWR